MLLNKTIKIELTNRNYKKSIKKYNLDSNLKVGDVVDISIDLLTKGSKYKVDVRCHYCHKEFKIEYRRYVNSTKDVEKISCSDKKCSSNKIKDVNLKKYGVSNVFKSEEIKKKIKKKLNKKYGVDHPMLLKETKDKIKTTCLERYGETSYTKTDDYLKKTKITNLKKYNTEWSLQNETIKEKAKKTNLSKYGFEYSSQSPIVKQKFKETCLNRYGVSTNLKGEETKNKILKTNLRKRGVDNIMKDSLFRKKFNISNDPHYIKYLNDKISLFSCDGEESHNFEISSDNYISRINNGVMLCTKCNPIESKASIKEKSLRNFIKSNYNGKILSNYRDGLEIDIYLPDINIGFEFNGLYWHCDKYKGKNYHISKTKHFKNKGIRIINIWEDDWDNKNDIIKSQVLNWLNKTTKRIYARKCKVMEIKRKECSKFLNENHIQGKDMSSLKIGLYYNSELVSVMTFNKNEGRYKMNENGWNLSRFCNLINTNIIGGASKLFKYFERNYKPNRTISYADNDWSVGNLYFKLGFDLINEPSPDYKYIVDKKRVNKSKYRKSKLKTSLTESEEMSKRGINKIWDCGKLKFEKIKKEG